MHSASYALAPSALTLRPYQVDALDTLLKRSLDVDALKCPKCSGRLRILAAVTNASEAKRILAHLGRPTAASRRARARDPTDDLVDVEVESWADC